jgi:hypothetical protein
MVMEVVDPDRPAALLPAVTADARLPINYLEAKAALARCNNLDEAAEWADKAAAIAAYAIQAKDTSLEHLARRIRARAMRRAGELLQAIPTARGRRTDLRPDRAVGARTRAAAAAGMSESQHKVAVRVASIPAAEFEAAVEAPEPPGVARLAGRTALRPPPPNADSDGGFDRARGLLSALLVCYRGAPPAVKARIRDLMQRTLLALDTQEGRVSPMLAPLVR